MIVLLLAALALGGLLGRATAGIHPAHIAVDWAEEQLATRSRRSPWSWIASLAVVGAVITVFLFHPFRSTVNVLARRDDPERVPAPDLDPNRAAKHGAPAEPARDDRAAAKCGPACAEQHRYVLGSCARSCARIGGGVADMSWTVCCPNCGGLRDGPCRRSDGSAASVSCGARWDDYDRAQQRAGSPSRTGQDSL